MRWDDPPSSRRERIAEREAEDQGASLGRRERNARLIIVLMLGFAISLLLIGVFFAWTQLSPQQPMTIYSTRLLTHRTCPLGDVVVQADYKIDAPNIQKLVYTSTWEEVGQPNSTQTGGEQTVEEPKPVSRTRGVSPAVRNAPVRAGTWALHTDLAVVWEYYGVPRVDNYEYDTHGTLEVLPLTDPECLEKG